MTNLEISSRKELTVRCRFFCQRTSISSLERNVISAEKEDKCRSPFLSRATHFSYLRQVERRAMTKIKRLKSRRTSAEEVTLEKQLLPHFLTISDNNNKILAVKTRAFFSVCVRSAHMRCVRRQHLCRG
jgi:hypothetical protein